MLLKRKVLIMWKGVNRRQEIGSPMSRFTLDNPSDAKAYQARLEVALRALKTFIADNARPARPTRLEF